VLLVGWTLGVVVSIGGIFLSYKFDLPTAPVIVLSLSVIFFGFLAVRAWIRWKRESLEKAAS
jgi:ABC-type Mn2+/Zn2+ transport system permease subunit